jgi:hypothetical protein
MQLIIRKEERREGREAACTNFVCGAGVESQGTLMKKEMKTTTGIGKEEDHLNE